MHAVSQIRNIESRRRQRTKALLTLLLLPLLLLHFQLLPLQISSLLFV
jgi:hypothetical protein